MCYLFLAALPPDHEAGQFLRSKANESYRAFAVKLVRHDGSTRAGVTWGSLIAVTGITSVYTLYRTAWFVSISQCQPVIKRIYERALEKLDETNGDDLKSTKFELLWWTSYLSTSKR